MSGVRLTRRGRLLLHTLPLFVVTAAGLQAIANRTAASQRAPRAAATPASPSATSAPSPSPSPAARHTPSPTPTPTPTPARHRTTETRTPTYAMAPGTSAVHGTGPVHRFTVEVERGLADSPSAVAAAIERILFDRRGWSAAYALQRVDHGAVAFRVVLASPRTTDRLCAPLRTGGLYSCYQHGRAVLNATRWHGGARTYAGDLASYRIYMVNHEVGHALGHGHRYECGAGGLAYVMIQQTKDLLGCRRNPWPLPAER